MLFNKKFDLIISIGEDCACTSYLRRFNLQKYSYPFDWLTNASFETRIELLLNNFKDFLNFEDIKFMNISNPTKHDSYKNTKNNFYYYHDFEKNIPLKISYPKVKEKYEKRIKRLQENIENSEKILFVWWSKSKLHNIDLIKNAYISLKEKYSKKSIYLLFIENYPKEEYLEFFDGDLLILHYDNASYKHNPKWNETMGNEKNNMRIFSQLRLKLNMSDYLNILIYKFLKILINLVPQKTIRHQLRSKLDFYKKHAKL